MNHYQHPTTKQVRAVAPFEFAKETTVKGIDGKDVIIPAVKSISELQYEKNIADGFPAQPMTAAQFEAFRNPPPSPERLFEQGRATVQKMLDEIAVNTYGFSSGNALLIYAGFPNVDKDNALHFAAYEASCWDAAKAVNAQVMAGERSIPTATELLAAMPVFVP
ncbi:hypothetical protein UFOVP607_2 [uncultured Caudovirales phage]|uniref:Uncharacterized protein n=1 Tax=uncultured Caudovirales phage TaxID=2100421 RepID=A0A6J5MYF4_9CAUD|nr:hypothetical protein UFOVP607_2 [uncultured Caudovirales phage]